MKKTTLSMLLLALFLIPVSGKNVVIENPAYEVKNSGIDNIVKVERLKTETRVYVRTTFIPNWWVKFPKATFILPEGSNEKIFATGIENGEFDKEIYMPASGDSLFVLVFPPLDKSVKKFDYGEEDKTIIFGVSLEKNKQRIKTAQRGVPDDVEAWLSEELDNTKIKEVLPDYRSDKFFNRQPARLVGYIKGYDPRLGFSTGIIYTDNVITRESFPITLNIHPDGRFEADIPMHYPTIQYMAINDKTFDFYLEPGHTLAMVMDWEEFLIADRLRNIRYTFKDIGFTGGLAGINKELITVELKDIPWGQVQDKSNSLSPEEYKAYELQILDENRELIDRSASSEKLKLLLTNEALLRYGTNLLEYVSNYKRRLLENPASLSPMPDDYYGFLQQIPMNDQSLLCASNVSVFVNRFEYCEPFISVWRQLSYSPETFLQHLKDESQGSWTDEDEKMKEVTLQLNRIESNDERTVFYETHKADLMAFNEKYAQQIDKYMEELQKDRRVKEMQLRDSVLVNELHLSTPNLIYDITKVRSLESQFTHLSHEEEANGTLILTTENIDNPFLIAEATRIYRQSYPEDGITSYELPENEAGQLFREMIAPLKGKYVVTDFWESSCGPCIAGIKGSKELREKLQDSSDIAFLFICSEDTPEGTYKTYVEEQALVNSYRLTKDQYNRMRELFKFSGIPHYETVDREGKIMMKGISMYNLETSLMNLLKKENANEL